MVAAGQHGDIDTMASLTGKVAIVTGGAKGIGLACANAWRPRGRKS
jgi:NADP-dependent 3-hydroxy acid dehydrogenase YdfG